MEYFATIWGEIPTTDVPPDLLSRFCNAEVYRRFRPVMGPFSVDQIDRRYTKSKDAIKAFEEITEITQTRWMNGNG